MKAYFGLLLPAFCVLLVQCNRPSGSSDISIKGGWYVYSITDKASGNTIGNSLPADSIIIYFTDDTAYSGHTHRNLFSGKYSFNGQNTAYVNPPVSYLLAEDSLGNGFMYLLRGCYPGYFTCTGAASFTTVNVTGTSLYLDNFGKYKAWLKKIP